MSRLILEPSSTAQWQNIVVEAQNNCKIELHEEHESYLVFMLMRYTADTELLKGSVAVRYLTSLQQTGTNLRTEQLRDVGDHCLIYCGLFPSLAQVRRVSLTYFIDMGKSAYHWAGEQSHGGISELYQGLSQVFINLMDIMHAIREHSQQPLLQPLQAMELYHQHGAQYARSTLDNNIHKNNNFSMNGNKTSH